MLAYLPARLPVQYLPAHLPTYEYCSCTHDGCPISRRNSTRAVRASRRYATPPARLAECSRSHPPRPSRVRRSGRAARVEVGSSKAEAAAAQARGESQTPILSYLHRAFRIFLPQQVPNRRLRAPAKPLPPQRARVHNEPAAPSCQECRAARSETLRGPASWVPWSASPSRTRPPRCCWMT
jgi:hypothetical protein